MEVAALSPQQSATGAGISLDARAGRRRIALSTTENEMRDVLARLMQWMETSDIDDAHVVLRDAITEIVRLRTQVDMLRDEVADAKKWAMSERGLKYDALVAADKARSALSTRECDG